MGARRGYSEVIPLAHWPELCRQYRDGYTLREIAALWSIRRKREISHEFIRIILMKCGEKLRPRGYDETFHPKPTEKPMSYEDVPIGDLR